MAARHTQGSASALPTPATVTPIRPSLKVPKKNRVADDLTISFASLARRFEEKARTLGETEPDSEAHRLALHMAGIREKVPSNNLRLILSTLDERRDFDLRCAEVEVAKAEHDLEAKKIRVLDAMEPDVAWWDSPTRKPLVDANNERWRAYRAMLVELAETPAHNRHQLERKIRLIGKGWLNAEGEPYQRMRAAVAADQQRLDETQPLKRRARKVGQ